MANNSTNVRLLSALLRGLGAISPRAAARVTFELFRLAGPRREPRFSPAPDAVEQHITPQGEKLHVQVMKSPLFDHDGKPNGIQGIFWDVTARIRAEEQLKEHLEPMLERAGFEIGDVEYGPPGAYAAYVCVKR